MPGALRFSTATRSWWSPEISHNSKEVDQPGGREARNWTEKLVLGKDVTIRPRGKSYNRIVAEVLIDGKSVNAGLVQAGHAWVDKRYTSGEAETVFLELEAEARKARRGLWMKKKALSPWEWRKR